LEGLPGGGQQAGGLLPGPLHRLLREPHHQEQQYHRVVGLRGSNLGPWLPLGRQASDAAPGCWGHRQGSPPEGGERGHNAVQRRKGETPTNLMNVDTRQPTSRHTRTASLRRGVPPSLSLIACVRCLQKPSTERVSPSTEDVSSSAVDYNPLEANPLSFPCSILSFLPSVRFLFHLVELLFNASSEREPCARERDTCHRQWVNATAVPSLLRSPSLVALVYRFSY